MEDSAQPTTAPSSPASVVQLRSRWKPTKVRLLDSGENEDLCIRIHRACSWLQRVEEFAGLAAEADPQPDPRKGPDPTTAWYDDALVLRWIAFNSLYGVWDEERREPARDLESCSAFLRRVIDLDNEGVVGQAMEDQRELVLAILEDGFVDKYFWKSPGEDKLRKASRAVFKGRSLYVEGRLFALVDLLIRRVYNVRCQLVHGAASRGGDLNRDSVQRCAEALGYLLPAFLTVVIDQGADVDWGPLCYPPISLGGDVRDD